ncbi:MAG: hypothetical protein WC992_06315 [Acholeplasmataceae bacterium]
MLEMDKLSNRELLRQVVAVVQGGHYNDTIRDTLAGIARACGKPEIATQLMTLPDRTRMGSQEGWAVAALQLYMRRELEICGAQRRLACVKEK